MAIFCVIFASCISSEPHAAPGEQTGEQIGLRA